VHAPWSLAHRSAKLHAEALIRFLLHLLIAGVLAVALAVAGYALLLALRQGPAPAIEPVALSPVPKLPEPARLPRRASYVPASAPVFHTKVAERAPLAIEVRDLPDDLAASAGIAVFDARTGVALHWLPLAGLPRAGGVVRVQPEVPSGNALLVTLAGDESAARRGYWTRVEVAKERVAKDATADAPVLVSGAVRRITVRVAIDQSGYGQDMQLRRVGDEQWHPLAAGPRLVPGERGELTLLLGPGAYELAPCTGGPWQPAKIAVPGPTEVTATFERSPARGGRP